MPENSLFLRACWRQPVERPPVWLMRQAGRYMPEYRNIRSKVSFLELCKNPELATEVTLQPVDILGVDAAILFSDILVPAEAMGMKLHFSPAPSFEAPANTQAAIEALRLPEPEETMPFVLDTIRLLRQELASRQVPLIGFCGAPFTLACYMVEGEGSRHFLSVKKLMRKEPELYRQLMEKVTETSRRYLNAQIAAGAQAVQIFDTWAGILSPSDYTTFALPYVQELIAGLNRDDVPVIYFAKGAGTMLEKIKLAGADVVGLDWNVQIDQARETLGPDLAVQGNLDPAILFSTKQEIAQEAKRILRENAGRPGYIFNLGHGILPKTPVENVRHLIDTVQQFG